MTEPSLHFDEDAAAFARQGFVDLGVVLKGPELTRFQNLYQHDRQAFSFFWHPYGHHQHANYEALLTTPQFDELIRHPRIYPIIEELMGGPLCFGEIGLRSMCEYDGAFHQGWHRDKPHWMEHPLRMDYICLLYTSPSPRDGLLSRMPSSA